MDFEKHELLRNELMQKVRNENLKEVSSTYRSTLMAQRLNMDAVHSITSMVMRKSHISVFKDHTPP